MWLPIFVQYQIERSMKDVNCDAANRDNNAEACLVTSGIGAVTGELDSSGSTMPTQHAHF
jgi:hypothetical protein